MNNDTYSILTELKDVFKSKNSFQMNICDSGSKIYDELKEINEKIEFSENQKTYLKVSKSCKIFEKSYIKKIENFKELIFDKIANSNDNAKLKQSLNNISVDLFVLSFDILNLIAEYSNTEKLPITTYNNLESFGNNEDFIKKWTDKLTEKQFNSAISEINKFIKFFKENSFEKTFDVVEILNRLGDIQIKIQDSITYDEKISGFIEFSLFIIEIVKNVDSSKIINFVVNFETCYEIILFSLYNKISSVFITISKEEIKIVVPIENNNSKIETSLNTIINILQKLETTLIEKRNLEPQSDNPEEFVSIFENKINVFNKMPLSKAIKYFSVLTTEKNRNGEPYLTNLQFEQFINRAFLGNLEIQKQTLKFGTLENQKTYNLFYYYFDHCSTKTFIEPTQRCKEKYVRLLTDNFTNFSYEQVSNNFEKVPKNLFPKNL